MSLHIRMYNVGFGDCFLLTIPAADRPRKILIDCGKHRLSTGGPKLERVVQQVLEDIAEEGGRRIDLVVATHRHLDHVQGFSLQMEAWNATEVGEVWMPWTEDPNDAEARGICDRQSRRAQRVRKAIPKLGLEAQQEEYMLGYAGNNLTNEDAMNVLHNGFSGAPTRRFLPRRETAGQTAVEEAFRTEILPGVETFILGPPHSEAVLAEMDPPDEESFFSAWESGSAAAGARSRPFGRQWAVDRATFEARIGGKLEQFPEKAEQHLGKVTDTSGLEVAARIEGAVNSTSLVLLFHIGQAWLLFPGDAQWGSWDAILSNAQAKEMLAKLSFYKVGHHGSHNATPVSFVKEYLNKEVRVMLPCGPVKQWPTIPRQGLLDTLAAQQVPYARSDVQPAADGLFVGHDEAGEVLFIDTEVAI